MLESSGGMAGGLGLVVERCWRGALNHWTACKVLFTSYRGHLFGQFAWRNGPFLCVASSTSTSSFSTSSWVKSEMTTTATTTAGMVIGKKEQREIVMELKKEKEEEERNKVGIVIVSVVEEKIVGEIGRVIARCLAAQPRDEENPVVATQRIAVDGEKKVQKLDDEGLPVLELGWKKGMPSISLEKYIERLVFFINTSLLQEKESSVTGLRVGSMNVSSGLRSLIIAMVYLDRYTNKRGRHAPPRGVHRLLLVAMYLASKFCEDTPIRTSFFAKIGGISVEELHQLEIEFVKTIDFRLFVGEDEFNTACSILSPMM